MSPMRPCGDRSSKKRISKSNEGGAGGSAAEQSFTGVEEFLRIDGFAFDANFIMQMRSGRAPSRAELADNAACAHGVADRNVDLGEMTVAGQQPIAVVDLDHLTIAAAGGRDRNGARGGRANWIAGIAAEIDPGMHRCFVNKRIHANAEW